MTTATSVRPLGGSMTALITPFADGKIDWKALDALIDRQIEGGTDWIVALGTTAESPTLTLDERKNILSRVIERSNGRCGVLAGTGSNNTAATVEMSRMARDLGADAVMIVAPYYNKPPQEGLFRHFAAVAEAVTCPVVLYNVPPRTAVAISNETIIRLRQAYQNIAAVKHATGTVAGVTELRSQCDIAIISGDDSLTWPLMALGAIGVIGVVNNLVPAWMKSLVTAAMNGNRAAALDAHARISELADGIAPFGPNPIPIKTAMSICGLCKEEFRLPLCALGTDDRGRIESLIRRMEIA